MLCRRCKRPLGNPRSIKLRYGPRCYRAHQDEMMAEAHGDLFEGFKKSRRRKWRTVKTPYLKVPDSGDEVVLTKAAATGKSEYAVSTEEPSRPT